jgi:hypothetical protein
MKGKIILVVFTLSIIVSGTILVNTNNNDNKSVLSNRNDSQSTQNETLDGEKNNYQVYYTSDYLYTEPNDIFNHSSLVVIGEYVQDLKSFVGNDERAHTVSEFKISKVLKGDFSLDTIEIVRLGGTVPLSEYIATQTQEQLEKKGISTLSKSQIAKSSVEFISQDYNLNLKQKANKKFILLLNYDSDNEMYVASADEYSILEFDTSKNEVYNINNKQFENYSFIK